MSKITPEDINSFLRLGEGVNVEFKECSKNVPKDLWPTYSSFANTRGGHIILGVRENENPLPDKFYVTGIDDTDKIIDDLNTALNNPQKVSRNILPPENIYSVQMADKQVVVIDVPQADYRSKPIYLNGNKVSNSYKRVGQGDAHLTDDELSIMLRDASPFGGDSGFAEEYGLESIDTDALAKYRFFFNTLHPGHPFADISDKDFLTQIGGYKIDEREGKEGLTVAGLLMFGKGLAIRNYLPFFRLDYIDTTGATADGLKWNERLTYDGTWENNLYNFIRFVLGKINSGIPSESRVDGIVRKDDSPIYKALREAVTNSIIHCDYKVEGTLSIVKTDDGIELRNPGLLKIPKEKIYRGKYSTARNPKIQDMLRLIGYGDNIGSGMPLILSTWSREGLQMPELTEDRELLTVSLKLSFKKQVAHTSNYDVVYTDNGVSDESTISIPFDRSCWGYPLNRDMMPIEQTNEQINEQINLSAHLSAQQKEVLICFANNPTLSMDAIADKLGITVGRLRSIRRGLTGIADISHAGANKKGRWVVKLGQA